jgi:dUTP pyrophosphatase
VIATVKFRLLTPGARMPARQSDGAAGWDLYLPGEPGRTLILERGRTAAVPLGIASEMPTGLCARLVARSGLSRRGLVVGAGLIDSDYRGEWAIIFHHLGVDHLTLHAGDRVAQAKFEAVPAVRVVEADALGETARGAGAFGSTGR